MLLAGNGPDGAVDLSITCAGLDPDTGAGAGVAFEDKVAAFALDDSEVKQIADAASTCDSSSSAERACARASKKSNRINLN